MGWVMEEGILGASLRAVLDDQLLARSGAPHRAQLASFSLSLREVGDRSICVATCATLGLTALAERLRSDGCGLRRLSEFRSGAAPDLNECATRSELRLSMVERSA